MPSWGATGTWALFNLAPRPAEPFACFQIRMHGFILPARLGNALLEALERAGRAPFGPKC